MEGKHLILVLSLLASIGRAEKREKKGSLKWFPAEDEDECGQVPEQVQVSIQDCRVDSDYFV